VPDRGRSWGLKADDGDGVLNFGHRRVAGESRGALWQMHPSGVPIWSDTQTAMTPDQWALMPEAQRQEILALVPQADRKATAKRMAGGHAERALMPHPAGQAHAKPAGKPSAPRSPDLQARVQAAAQAATADHLNQPGACYRTAEATAERLGGDLRHARDQVSARGLSLSHLEASEKAGKLMPGMAIYCNLQPGTDPDSVIEANLPHWMTYLGRDPHGVMRFSDQYGADLSLAEVVAAYQPRVIDALIDPLAHLR
jgi:hypothetical protein